LPMKGSKFLVLIISFIFQAHPSAVHHEARHW
jgi:hypothetical protein